MLIRETPESGSEQNISVPPVNKINYIHLTALKTFSEAPVDVSTVTPKAFTPTSSFEGKQLWF